MSVSILLTGGRCPRIGRASVGVCVVVFSAVVGLQLLAQSPAALPRQNVYSTRADALMRGYVDAGRFSGAVLVAQDGKPIFRQAYGLANREWDIPATLATKFRIASVTKQFTAAAILQLNEQRKVQLDGRIAIYYKDAPLSIRS